MRRFRLWEKKRGHRTTGSPVWGRVGEALFYAAVFLIGAAGLAGFVAIGFIADNPAPPPWDWSHTIVLLVFLSLLISGALGVLYCVMQVGTSAERRSALAQRARLDVLADRHGKRNSYPSLPSEEDLTNSPGVKLTYRLPMSFSSGWGLLFSVALFCLFWNGTAAVLIGLVARQFRAGHIEWIFVLFVITFSLVGGWSTQFFFQQLAQATAVGATALEISDHPVFPGASYKVYLSQSGRLTIRRLEVSLVCDEEATYRQGTDIRTERRRVFDQSLFAAENIEIGPGQPYEREDKLVMPAPVMHSFQAPHNSIQWKLLVRGEVTGWPRFERAFPIIVYPATLPGSIPHAPARSPLRHGTPHQHPTV